MWELWLDKKFICGGFATPQDAASCAQQHDFEDETQRKQFAYIRVTDDLTGWALCSEREVQAELADRQPKRVAPTEPGKCPPRKFARIDSTRLN
jgi:hypothetical protein